MFLQIRTEKPISYPACSSNVMLNRIPNVGVGTVGLQEVIDLPHHFIYFLFIIHCMIESNLTSDSLLYMLDYFACSIID